jgi:hypothetical protein
MAIWSWPRPVGTKWSQTGPTARGGTLNRLHFLTRRSHVACQPGRTRLALRQHQGLALALTPSVAALQTLTLRSSVRFRAARSPISAIEPTGQDLGAMSGKRKGEAAPAALSLPTKTKSPGMLRGASRTKGVGGEGLGACLPFASSMHRADLSFPS